jgi:predicted phage terminase large subunit-like protein
LSFEYFINQYKKISTYSVREKVTDDLMEFVCDTHLKMYNERFVVRKFHEEMCEILTQCALMTLKNPIVVFNLPPRFGKSALLARYIEWCFLHNPKAKFIYATYSQKLALTVSREIKKNLMSIHGMKTSFDKDSAELWTTHDNGMFLATSILGAAVGFGAGDIYATPYSGAVILDDCQKPVDAFYETQRDSVNTNFSNTFWSRRNNLDKIPLIQNQQRLHVDDLSGYIMKRSGYSYTHFKVKALNDQGESNFPERVSKETLLELKQASEYTFLSQQQQEPILSTGGTFKVDKIQIMPHKEFTENYEYKCVYFVRSFDFAGVSREKNFDDKRDWTRGVLMGTDGEKVYILDMVSHRGSVGDNDVLLINTASRDHWSVVYTIPADPGVAGEHYVDHLRSLPDLKGKELYTMRRTTNKQLHAAPFASFVNTGKVVIISDEDDKNKWNYDMLDEMRGFPNATHDDIIDCLADGYYHIHNIKKFI